MFAFQETWKIILFIAAFCSVASGAPVSCDSTTAQRCLSDFLTELEQIALNSTTESLASNICNVHPDYQQCISGCNPPIESTNVWVKATEYFCSINETGQNEGIECLVKPQVALGLQVCNANIPQTTSDFCSTRDDYLSCVHKVSSSLCSPLGDRVLREYLLYSLRAASIANNCDDTDTTTTTTPTTATTTTTLPTTQTVATGTEVCATDCFQFLSTPAVELMRGEFSLTLYTDACSNFTLYKQCLENFPDCDTSNIAQHFVLSDPFSYTCGPGYTDILSQKSCWDKPTVKNVWTSCLIGSQAPWNFSDVCSVFESKISCLSSGIAQHCDANASNIVLEYFNSTIHRVMLLGNCTISATTPSQPSELTTQPLTPEPESEGESNTTEPEAEVTAGLTTSAVTINPTTPEPEAEVTADPTTPEPEAEVTADPTTPEPEAEATAEPATPEPEAEVTAEPTTTTPEPAVTREPTTATSETEVTTNASPQCDIMAYSQCVLDFNQEITTWVQAVTLEVTRTSVFNISYIDTLCSTFLEEYVPCASPVLSVCPRDVTLVHETLMSALGYLCSVDRSDLLGTLSCLGQPAVTQGLLTCRYNIPQRTTNICQVSQDFAECIANVTFDVCTEDARSTLTKLVSVALQPLNDYYPCDITIIPTTTSTTTTPTTVTTTDTTTSTTTSSTTDTATDTTTDTATATTTDNVTDTATDTTTDTATATITDNATDTATSTTTTSTTDTATTSATDTTTDTATATTTDNATDTATSTTTDTATATITVASVRINCYECHSGYGSYQNPHCSPDGSVTDWYAAAITCKDRCFAKTNKWNKGVIVRGCAGRHLPVDHPRPLPRSGCENIRGETWCFCDTNKCNTMSMVDYLP